MKRSLVLALALSLLSSGCGGGGGEVEEPICGDGIVADEEICDDGNLEDGDGCDADCQPGPICGDGALSPGEVCPEDQAEEIDDYIRSLSQLPTFPPTDGPLLGEVIATEQDGDYECVTQVLTQVQNNVEISAFAANSSVLFPGALVRGDTVYNDLLDPVVLPLKPVTFSVSLSNLSGASSATLQNPTLSEFVEKRNALLQAGVSGDVVVSAEAEILQVNSKEELSIALGIDVNTAAVDVGADFDFTSTEERSHFLVRIKQILYTVDLDLPARPSDLLADGVTLSEAQELFTNENPPLYVQQLIYGRLLYFTFESDVSSSELDVALKVAFTNGATDVNAETSLSSEEVLQRTEIKGYVIGGSASSDISQLLGGSVEGVKTFIAENTNFPADDFTNFGQIIGFKLGYLSDNSTAVLSFGGETTIRECLRARQKVSVTLESIAAKKLASEAGDNDLLEIFGSLFVEDDNRRGTTRQTLFSVSRGGANTVPVDNGSLTIDNTKIVEVDFQANPPSMHFLLDLTEADALQSNDEDFFKEVVVTDFRTAFGAPLTVVINGSNQQLTLTFTLTPVP